MATKKTEAEASTEAKTPARKPAAAKAEKPVAAKAAKPAAAKADKPAAAKAPKKQAPVEGAGGTLRLHHLRPAPGSHTAKTRVGRGEGSKGKTAGRGTKGTKARYQVPERREGGGIPLHMRVPKLRGFKNPFRTTYQVVNIERLGALRPGACPDNRPIWVRVPHGTGRRCEASATHRPDRRHDETPLTAEQEDRCSAHCSGLSGRQTCGASCC